MTAPDDTPRPPLPDKPPRRRFGFAEIDALVDNAVFRLGQWLVDLYAGFSAFCRRFRLHGWKKAVSDIVGTGLNFAALGSVGVLALALPAFDAARQDWRARGDYAVNFLDRYGNEIGRRGAFSIDTYRLEDFPDHLIKATLATEDRRFFEHFGIDVIGTARAIFDNLRGNGGLQGGSSITQQLAKNLFLSNERTLDRKIKEAFLAMWLETHYSKKDILKLYLDRAYMGGGAFGVAAASEFYFGKSVKDINLAEAAMLSGLYKAPTKYAPHANPANARLRANEVLTNLVQAGFMTEGQVLSARRNPAKAVDRTRIYTPDYFLDFAFDQIVKMGLPERTLTARTTIDIGLQKTAEDSVEKAIAERGEELNISQGAAVIMEPDGVVRAMVGGRDYGASQFNRATAALRQPGSSIKPYVYLAALTLSNKTPNSTITDTPYCIGDWCPGNFGNSYFGRVTLTEAISRSLNSVPVQLAQAIGREKLAAFIKQFGIPLPDKPEWPFVIGAVEVHILDQAVGFAAFANGGMKVEATGVEEVTGSTGQVLWDRTRNMPEPRRVVAADKIEQLNGMLNNAVERGTGTRARMEGIPAGGKTGTTQSSRDAWFCGFTGNYVGIVWVGNDDYKPMEKVTGGMVPAPIWNEIMTYAHQNIELKRAPGFPPPAGFKPPAVADGPRPAAPAANPGGSIVTVARPATTPERSWALSPASQSVLSDIGESLKARRAEPLKTSSIERRPAAGGGSVIRLARR